jgi:hypothetical protein
MAAPKPTNLPRFGTLAAWQATTYYPKGIRVTNGGNLYVCAPGSGNGGLSGSSGGPTGTGSGIVDGAILWDYVSAASAAWIASAAYTLGELVSNGGNLYMCIKAGTAAGSGGPTGTGIDITDGSVHWTYVSTDAATPVAPSGGQADLGWLPGQKPPANYFTWLLWTIYLWCVYLQDLAAQTFTWTAPHTWSSTSSANFQCAVAVQSASNPNINQIAIGTNTSGISGVGTGTGFGVAGVGGGTGGYGALGVGGNGGGAGVRGVGGASGGPGVQGVGTDNAPGVVGEGNGSFAGLEGHSEGGPAVYLRAKTRDGATIQPQLEATDDAGQPRFILDHCGFPLGRLNRYSYQWTRSAAAGAIGTGAAQLAAPYDDWTIGGTGGNAIASFVPTVTAIGCGAAEINNSAPPVLNDSWFLRMTNNPVTSPDATTWLVFAATWELAITDVAKDQTTWCGFSSDAGASDYVRFYRRPGVHSGHWRVDIKNAGVGVIVVGDASTGPANGVYDSFRVEVYGSTSGIYGARKTRFYLNGVLVFEYSDHSRAAMGFLYGATCETATHSTGIKLGQLDMSWGRLATSYVL